MLNSENDFTEFQNLKLFVGTWNVNGKKPTESLTEWLLGDSSERTPTVYILLNNTGIFIFMAVIYCCHKFESNKCSTY